MGLIPLVHSWRDHRQPVVVSVTDPTSPAAESYRTLRTNIQFAGLDRSMRAIQVTSPSASEGKTTTLANLAVALAGAGLRVTLVCCDLRRPRLHQFFGLNNTVGFTSVLLGEKSISQALQPTAHEGLTLLASGPPPPNPAELLSSNRTSEVLTALKLQSDMLLLDSPPVLPVTDAAVLSPNVDATLLVATAGKTSRKKFGRAVELLNQVGAPIIGVVLNGVSGEGGYGYEYATSYAYSTAAAKDDGRRKWWLRDREAQTTGSR
jgi:non-specific protein-tyrosine kinase